MTNRTSGASNVRKLTLIVAALTVLCGGRAANAENPKVDLGWAGGTVSQYAVPIAEALGYFRDAGVDVNIRRFGSTTRAVQAMMAGTTDLTIGFYDQTIRAQSLGQAVKAVVQVSRGSGMIIATVGDVKINDIKDWTRLKVGTPGKGSFADMAFTYFLKKHGLSGDYINITVGPGASAVAAAEQQQVDVIMAWDPGATLLEKRGLAKVVFDGRTPRGEQESLGSTSAGMVAYGRADRIEGNGEGVQRFVTAIVRALAWMRKRSAEEIVAVLPEVYRKAGDDLVAQAIDNSKEMFAITGKLQLSELKVSGQMLQSADSKIGAIKIDYDKTFTNQFVDKALTATDGKSH